MADVQGGDQQQHFIDQLESETSLSRQDLASVIYQQTRMGQISVWAHLKLIDRSIHYREYSSYS